MINTTMRSGERARKPSRNYAKPSIAPHVETLEPGSCIVSQEKETVFPAGARLYKKKRRYHAKTTSASHTRQLSANAQPLICVCGIRRGPPQCSFGSRQQRQKCKRFRILESNGRYSRTTVSQTDQMHFKFVQICFSRKRMNCC